MTDNTEVQRIKEIKKKYRKYKYTRLTPHTREKFLEKLKETANVSLAADLVGINRIRAYQLKKKDKEFSDLWDEAIEIGTDMLEYKARIRAMDGVKRPVFYKGEECGYITEYSDRLMETLLAAHRPGKYNRSMVDLPQGAEIIISVKTSGNAESKAIDVTPRQIEEEEVAITDDEIVCRCQPPIFCFQFQN